MGYLPFIEHIKLHVTESNNHKNNHTHPIILSINNFHNYIVCLQGVASPRQWGGSVTLLVVPQWSSMMRNTKLWMVAVHCALYLIGIDGLNSGTSWWDVLSQPFKSHQAVGHHGGGAEAVWVHYTGVWFCATESGATPFVFCSVWEDSAWYVPFETRK